MELEKRSLWQNPNSFVLFLLLFINIDINIIVEIYLKNMVQLLTQPMVEHKNANIVFSSG